jgi:hypothetical protein
MSCQARQDEHSLDQVAQLLSPYVCRAKGGSLTCEPRHATPVFDVNSKCHGRSAEGCNEVRLMGQPLCEWK